MRASQRRQDGDHFGCISGSSGYARTIKIEQSLPSVEGAARVVIGISRRCRIDRAIFHEIAKELQRLERAAAIQRGLSAGVKQAATVVDSRGEDPVHSVVV